MGITRGQDGRMPLIDGTYLYSFYDIAASYQSYYKWRFSNNGSLPTSLFSNYVLGRDAAILDASNLSIAVHTFVDVEGRPNKTKVLVALEAGAQLIGTTMLTGGLTKEFQTDDQGFMAIPLVRGARVRVAIEGTNLVRTITIPNSPSFDIVQAISDTTDPLTVQQAPEYASRRSL
jgi:hypothetical protein